MRWRGSEPYRALLWDLRGGCCYLAIGLWLAFALSSSASLLHLLHQLHHPDHRRQDRQHQQLAAQPTPPSLLPAWRGRQRPLNPNGPSSPSRSPRSSPPSSICPSARPGSTAACVSSGTTSSMVHGDWVPPVVLSTGESFGEISFPIGIGYPSTLHPPHTAPFFSFFLREV